MKKKLKIAFSLYSPHLLWELVFVAQVVTFIACSVMLITNFVQQQYVYRAFADVFSRECVYFQPYDRLVELFLDPETDAEMRTLLTTRIHQYAEEITPNCEIGTTVNDFGVLDDQTVKVVGYNQIMAERMGISDYWKQADRNTDGAIPVLIRGALCERYGVGDRFSMEIGDDFTSIRAIVMERIDEDFQLILPSYGASEPTIDGFFDADIIADDPLENANAVVFCFSGDEPWLSHFVNPARFIFAGGDGISMEKLSLQDGAVGGKYFMMRELIDNTVTQNIYVNRNSLSKVFAAATFTIVSLFGYVFLLFVRNQRLLGIYTILGMSRRDMYSVIALAIGICVTVAVMLYAVFSAVAIQTGIYTGSDSSALVLICSTALVVLSILLGTLACSLFISRWQPVQYLKGD